MLRAGHLGWRQRRFWESNPYSVSRVRCGIGMITLYCPIHSTNRVLLLQSHNDDQNIV